MDRKYINSTMISSIGFDSSQAILEVEFKSNGEIWQYFDVPEHLWYEMESAPSVGRFFNSHIKNIYVGNRVG